MASVSVDLIARQGNKQKVALDKQTIRDYVKDDLFYRIVFVWTKQSLEEDGHLHKDFIKNCRSKIENGLLLRAEDTVAKAYLNYLWQVLVGDKCYNVWLSQKRSNVYQAMQDKFLSKYS